ncbi:MAG: DNA-binding protein [Erythrobacter sp.]|nr:DNA-binding protein [Erythrobacter sp.]
MTDQTQLAGTLLTRTEVAGLLAVTPRTLYRWELSDRGPPSIKVGRASYYRRETLDAWLLSLEGVSPVATVARRKA